MIFHIINETHIICDLSNIRKTFFLFFMQIGPSIKEFKMSPWSSKPFHQNIIYSIFEKYVHQLGTMNKKTMLVLLFTHPSKLERKSNPLLGCSFKLIPIIVPSQLNLVQWFNPIKKWHNFQHTTNRIQNAYTWVVRKIEMWLIDFILKFLYENRCFFVENR